MPSNKEILNAQRFNRRRLIAAFSAGMPDGKEVEPRSPARPLIVGTIICIVMLIGATIWSRFSPVLPQGWENSHFIVVSDTGARYFTINGTLRPVTNVTSARLLAEPGQFNMSRVSASTISGLPKGSAVGLVDIPDEVPAADALVSDLWLSCALESGTHTWIGSTHEGPTPHASALVLHNEDYYLIADGVRHLIDPKERTGILIALGLDALTPMTVSAEWLNLFEQGSDLKPLEIKGAGLPASGMPPRLASAVIGSVIKVGEGESARPYIVTGDSSIAPLTDLAARLYGISPSQAIVGNNLEATVAELSSLTVIPEGYAPADWPDSITDTIDGASAPCATLVIQDGGVSTQLLGWDIQQATSAAVGKPVNADDTPAAPTAPVTVAGGSAALIRTTAGGSLGATMIITDDGKTHGLGTNFSDTVARLGWSDTDIVLIPAPWAALVPPGKDLLPSEAWKTVAQR